MTAASSLSARGRTWRRARGPGRGWSISRDAPRCQGSSTRTLRDARGEPTGLLLEEADSLARNRLPDWSDAQYLAGVEEMVRIAHRYGITAVNDADASEPLLRAYHAADAAGRLKMRVAASLSTPYGRRTTPLDSATFEALRDRYASAHVDTRFVKIYLDGVPTSARTAAMLAPYQPHPDFPAGHTGAVHVDADVLGQDIAAFEARGFTVKLHTAGDRAIRVALDAIEAAHRVSGRTDLRHELAHAGFIDETDLPRFRALNVAADLSPYLWYPSPINDSIVGAVGERGRHYWPIRTLAEAGVALLAGSDWPAAVASMDPWIGLATMVTRRDPAGRAAGALWPAQAIDLERALAIFTRDGARALRIEHHAGTLNPGKSADVIVLDRDLLQTAPDALASTQVDMTFFAGECVWDRGAN
ncbi:MAG: amidohydrolase [Gammaproteobacteria bacterium]